MDRYAVRRDRLHSLLASESLDAFLISHPINVSYLTGFTGEASHLVVGNDKTVLVSDGRFTAQIAEECPGLETYIRPPTQPIQQASAIVLERLAAANIGFESGHLTVADHETLRGLLKTVTWKAGNDWVERFRSVKDEDEVKQIRAAIHMAEKAFAMFRAMLTPEADEKTLTDAMESYVRRAGGKETSFPTIVAVGPRAALPHAPPSSACIHQSNHVLIDWGAAGTFYKSDLTRVLWSRNNGSVPSQANGADEAKLREVYAVVLRAQAAAIAALKPGMQAKEIDAAARNVIVQAGFGDFFTHSVGHGIGMQVHEAPLMRANTETVLKPGMVVTVEPGIYLPNWGGVRIEDDVLITPDGHEVLTSVPKDWESARIEF
jgi:Xaa-Pro aminopeptidase